MAKPNAAPAATAARMRSQQDWPPQEAGALEFTGERVIPGHVNADLWAEHVARYALAGRMVAGARVLDAGCGTGYGTAELAAAARRVTGIDVSSDAVAYARVNFHAGNTAFARADCAILPFASGAFDVVVAFEVIEHLPQYRAFIAECARVLEDAGLLIVSTPNRAYYAETRAETGPNPFHAHEFDSGEFTAELGRVFPHVTLLAQNRTDAFVFYSDMALGSADARIAASTGTLDESHFIVAVCSRRELPLVGPFVYVPQATNLLRTRERHVRSLEQQLAAMTASRNELLALTHALQAEVEERNHWAAGLNAELETARGRIAELDRELIETHANYTRRTAELERTVDERTAWANRLNNEIAQTHADLAKTVALLDRAEETVKERTAWALRLEAQLNVIRSSRWAKLARALRLGPPLGPEQGKE